MSDEAIVRMRRMIPAPRDRVFHAWTDPEELKRWWGPGLFTTQAAEVDLRPGGGYRLIMRTPDGGTLVLAGTFREVVPPERLVYTWRWDIGVPDIQESLVTVEFSDVDGATEIALTHEHAPGSVLDPYHMGWDSGLEKLAAVVLAG